MDKDRLKGKAKDIAGRVQRQAGEWSGSEEQQAKGSMKQLEGKAQNVIGQAKDAARKAASAGVWKRSAWSAAPAATGAPHSRD